MTVTISVNGRSASADVDDMTSAELIAFAAYFFRCAVDALRRER